MRKIYLLFVDGVIILGAFLAGYWLRFALPLFPEKGVAPISPYLGIAWFSAGAWLLIFSILGLYRNRLFSNFCSELACLLQGSFWAMVFIMAGTALYRGFSYSRLALAFSGLLAFCGLSLCHFLVRFCFGGQEKKVVFVGQKHGFEKILKRFQLHHPSFNIQIYSENDLDNLRRNLSALQPGFLIVSESTPEVNRFLQELSEELSIPLYILPQFKHFLFSGQVENIDGLPLLLSGPLPLERWPAFLLKRATDIFLGAVFCLLFCLLLPAVALAICLDSPGPLFFTQPRIGRNRRIFRMFKLRSMKYPFSKSPPFTLQNDPRITRVGRFLRRFNLDELPQIFNVLSGEMSLVGPRPISCEDTFFFQLPDFHRRLRIKPGLTGWQ